MTHYNSYPYTHLLTDKIMAYLASKTLLKTLLPLPRRFRKILDIGCGASAIMERFNQAYWQRQLTAIDTSKISLAAASQLAPAHYQLSSAVKLPFTSRSFDLILSNGVIHHIPEYLAVFQEISRVLKPNGRVYLTLYHPYHPYRLGYFIFTPLRYFFPSFWISLLPFFYWPFYGLASLIILQSLPYLAEARADLADRFFNPYVHFFSPGELLAIFKSNHLKLIHRGHHGLYSMNSYLLTKYV